KADSEKERVLYVLLAATGLRISEALALETKHFTNNGRTIVVEQQVERDEPGMGWHSFRRYRKTWLRGKRCQEDINNYWMGHQPETMSELYSRLDEDLTTRLREAEIVGVGFEV